MLIYKTTNLLNNKSYIGQTKTDDKCYLGSGIALEAAVRKYGRNNFVRTTLINCETQKQLNLMEKLCILLLKTKYPDGYNIANGGFGTPGVSHTFSDEVKETISKKLLGHEVSEETRKKISESKIGTPSPRKGCHLSEETKKKLSDINKGKKMSEDNKRKLSEANKGNSYRTGIPWSIETREKIMNTRSKNNFKHSEESKLKISNSQKERIRKLRENNEQI